MKTYPALFLERKAGVNSQNTTASMMQSKDNKQLVNVRLLQQRLQGIKPP